MNDFEKSLFYHETFFSTKLEYTRPAVETNTWFLVKRMFGRTYLEFTWIYLMI